VCFEDIVDWMAGNEAGSFSHGEVEDGLDRRGRELLRRLLQDHLDLRAQREQRIKEVLDADGVSRGSVEAGHTRALTTIFGTVSVERLAYRYRGAPNLHPADAALNLPTERHSHGLRRLAAVESTRGSYDDAAEAIGRATGVAVAKRQVEDLTRRAATDVRAFYDARAPEPGASDDVLVISVDGKGIVMRPDSLRTATEKAAAAATNKLGTRLSKGSYLLNSHYVGIHLTRDPPPPTKMSNFAVKRAEHRHWPQPTRTPVQAVRILHPTVAMQP